MARRTQVHTIMPWQGGVNTSVDSGVLNEQELVRADNVVFSATGSRQKREALEYLDNDIPTPDFRSSSTTTRTLKWTTNRLIGITRPDQRLVVGEPIAVTGSANYNTTSTPITAVTSIQQVTDVVCLGDTAGSLNETYFLISAGDLGEDYYVWFNVDSGGSDPAVANKVGLEVAISANDSAATVAAAVQAIVHAETDFNASVVSNTVTITNAVGGATTDGSAGTSGFTVTVTTKGGHSISYTLAASVSESSTAAGAITVSRVTDVISLTDYWHYDNVSDNTQTVVQVTNTPQVFSVDTSGDKERVQILGALQVSTVVCGNGASLTSGDYFLLSSANDETDYYVWYNVDSGGGDPNVAQKTGVEVAVAAADTASQIATATKTAVDGLTPFTATVDTATVTITNVDQGLSTGIADFNTGFTFATTTWGATAPADTVDQVRTTIINETLLIAFSGIGNYPVKYRPEDSARYQALAADPVNSVPDCSFMFNHLGRVWANDKVDKHRLHFSETFDHTVWLGYGDSGAIDVNPGDGDPDGIINAFPYKGAIYVQKRLKSYRILGATPEEFVVELVSEGLGGEAQLAIPIDQSDVVFMTRRGVHSQQATDAYGDVDSVYLSAKIKPTFNSWEPLRLKYTQGTYIPELNSIALGIAEDGDSDQSAVWLYNFEVDLGERGRGAWYRWPDISCQAVSRQLHNGTYKLLFGTNDGRVIRDRAIANNFADYGTTGIEYSIKTGAIYPANNPASLKAFKKISMIYRPKGNFTFTVKLWIDNGIAQSFAFNNISGLDLLGETFILGNSLLGSSLTLAPYTWSLDGMGRGMVIEITQPSAEEQVEIWGIMIEYEDLDLREETV